MQTHFKVNLTGDAPADGITFSYNGSVIYPSTGVETFTQIAQYSNVSGTDAGKPINANALNLHIASRRELSSNKKSVRLFFLFRYLLSIN